MESITKKLDKLLSKDTSLWSSDFGVSDRLGWVDVNEWMDDHIDGLNDWALEVIESNKFNHIILLGMGGSSLAPEVFASIFLPQPGCPKFTMLDTTSPAQLSLPELNLPELDVERCLFIVSSKSGTTIETADLCDYFYEIAGRVSKNPGEHFIAITDQGSRLQQHAQSMGFLKVFINPSDIGGRYSALSYFGLVPAALIGVDLLRIRENIREFCCQVKSASDTSVQGLAKALGENAMVGRNQLILNISESIQSLSIWIEQLVAESTGKDGIGIIPVSPIKTMGNQPLVFSGDNRQVRVHIGYAPDVRNANDLGGAPEADLSWELDDAYDIAREFFRWELAVAIASSIMEINPFDQPDVEQVKIRTRGYIENGGSCQLNPIFENPHYLFYAQKEFVGDQVINHSREIIDVFKYKAIDSAYLGMLAFLPILDEVNDELERLRVILSNRLNLTTTLGFGPRYLHSTGQLHKGGPENSCFIQLIDELQVPLNIPHRNYGFHHLHSAQADGDYSILSGMSRPIMRIVLKGDRLRALGNLISDLSQ